jgi:hypothetical protein
MRRIDDNWEKWNKRLRDLGIYLLGVAGTVHELFIRSPREAWILPFCALLLGLPPLIRWDERRKEEEAKTDAPKE